MRKKIKKVKTSVTLTPQHLQVADQLAERERPICSRSSMIDHIIEVGLAAAAAKGVENFGEGMKRFSEVLNGAYDALQTKARRPKSKSSDHLDVT
jgi:hypothetical protein